MSPMKCLALSLVALIWLAGSALAQGAGPPTPPPVPIVGAATSLAVSVTSARVPLPAHVVSLNAVALLNDGATEIFVNLGTAAVTANTTSSVPIPAGQQITVYVGVDTYVAAITASSTSTLRVVLTNGALAYAGASGAFAAGSFVNATAADPCMFQAKTNVAFTTNGTSSVQLVALSGSTTIFVCSLHYVVAGATTVAFTTGTGTACITGNAAVIGSTTAGIANSMSYSANGGETYGNGGGTIAKGAASSALCMVLGTNVYVSGNLTYVQQ